MSDRQDEAPLIEAQAGGGQDEVREHAFDGIHEYDNRLPNWWLWTFYGAIIFSFFYWLHFHVLRTGDLPREAYKVEMQEAAERMAERMSKMEVTDESLRKMADEPGIVSKGQQIFVKNCATCHEENGGGNIGPNLTDEFWLHGARPVEIYQTIVNGVQGTAMAAWLNQLGPTGVQQVTAYVVSIKGTDVPGGKAPDLSRATKVEGTD